MEFGKLPEIALDNVDFSLPPEPLANAFILPGKKINTPQVYIGCPSWGTKEWIGKLYPTGIKEIDFLKQYVKHYRSIELNATHYKIYPPEAIAKWADKAKGKNFKFCPKIPQLISHHSNFIKTDELTTAFLEGVRAFKNQLGPIFLQLSEYYSPLQKKQLYSYLQSLPNDLQFFIEVRHPTWFSDKNIQKELFNMLASLKIGIVITDTAGRRDCAHMHLTVPKTFIRFAGNNLHPTDYTRIDEWVLRIKHWLDNGMQELYFFMHMPDDALSPELTVYLVDQLNKNCGLNLQPPVFQSPGLFGW